MSVVIDVNDWLGRSNWQDPFFGGSFNEFRIHDSMLAPLQVFASKAGGPNATNYTPENPTSITLVVQSNMFVSTTQSPTVNAQFPTYGQLTLEARDVTITSSDINVVEVNTNNNLLAVVAGTATITASLGGKTNSATVTVVLPNVYTALRHRYSFDEPAGSTNVTDSVGGSLYRGTVYPPTTNTVAPVVISNGVANFPGGSFNTCGYIALPPYLISSEFTNVTVEFWLTWNGPTNDNTFARVFDFGSSQKGSDPRLNGTGQSFIMFTPRRSGGGARNEFRASPDNFTGFQSTFNDQPASPGFPVGREVHVVSIFAPSIGYSALYVDGLLQNVSGTPQVGTPATNFLFNSSLWDPNIWLGVSQWADPPLNGELNELRIYEGVLDATYIALSREVGPDALPVPRPSLSISLSGSTLTFSWPTNAGSGFTLRSSTQLGAGAVWDPAGAPTLVGQNYQVIVPTTNNAAFFRLQQ